MVENKSLRTVTRVQHFERHTTTADGYGTTPAQTQTDLCIFRAREHQPDGHRITSGGGKPWAPIVIPVTQPVRSINMVLM